jgi:hypothetical protein
MFSENALMCPKCGCPTARAIKANESIGCFKVCLGTAFLGVIVVFGISQADKSPSASNVSSTSVSSEQVESPVKSMNTSKETEDMIVEEESVTSDSAETNDVIIDVASDENAVNSTGTLEDVVVEDESVTSNSVETDDVVKDETPKKKSFLRRMIQKHRKNKQRQN